MNIPFNRPCFTGNELLYIKEAVESGKISGDGNFSRKCHQFFEEKYDFKKCLLTTSCTDALEMAAILIDTKPDDEIIMPSYTFVSTANAFVLRGAKIVFADSRDDHPGIDEDKIEQLITARTKAIVPVHYAGVACDMHKIMKLADKFGLYVIEDAAQAIDSYYTFPDGTVKPLGGIGHLAAFSFHETKNVIAGEGGMLVVNHKKFIDRAEIIREKGTNRSAFFRGEVDKYGWIDIGSSFLPSEIIAAFLWAQLENMDDIQSRRKKNWDYYLQLLSSKKNSSFRLPFIPEYATNNAHMVYILLQNLEKRSALIDLCKQNMIYPAFHYLSLHKSPFYHAKHDGRVLKNSDDYSDCLLRLPFYLTIREEDMDMVVSLV